MKGTVTIIPAGTALEISSFEIAAPPTLEYLQATVGGYIEVVPFFFSYDGKPAAVFCNEEGKQKNFSVNPRADSLWKAQTGPENTDVLVGTVVILQGDAEFMAAL